MNLHGTLRRWAVSRGSEYLARMSPLRLALLLVPASLAAAAAVAIASPPAARDSAAAVITPTRVDGVHLGDTHADLRARGKVGPIADSHRPSDGPSLWFRGREMAHQLPLTNSMLTIVSLPCNSLVWAGMLHCTQPPSAACAVEGEAADDATETGTASAAAAMRDVMTLRMMSDPFAEVAGAGPIMRRRLGSR